MTRVKIVLAASIVLAAGLALGVTSPRSGNSSSAAVVSGASLASCSTSPCTSGPAPNGNGHATAGGCTPGPIAGTTNLVGLGTISDGTTSDCRVYGYYKPANLSGSPAAVVVSDGDQGVCGMTEPEAIYANNHWHTVANQHAFVVIYAAKTYNGTSCSGTVTGTFGWRHQNIEVPDPGTNVPNDEAYFSALVADIKSRLNVDAQRIYFTGGSNGGGETNAIACSAIGNLFRGFAPVSNLMQVRETAPGTNVPIQGTERCSPGAAHNFFHITVQGQSDGSPPYLGTCLNAVPGREHCIASWANSADWWGTHLGCKSGPTTTMFGTPTAANTQRTWSSCSFGLTAGETSLLIKGGCHSFQGVDAFPVPPSTCSGGGSTNPTNGFDSAADVWSIWANSKWTSGSSQTPTISSFTPTSGPAATHVAITGTNFTNVTSVQIVMGTNSKTATFTVNSPTQITATVPSGVQAGSAVKWKVTTSAGSVTSAGTFTITSGGGGGGGGTAPTISGFSPTSGARGSQVTITGTNFTNVTSVQVVTSCCAGSASYSVNASTKITATVPAAVPHGATVRWKVTTSAGSVTSTGLFTVT